MGANHEAPPGGSKPHRTRVLIVGAGPVGRVLGGHLMRAGVEVAWLVKPSQRGRFDAPFSLRVRRRFGSDVSYPMERTTLYTDPEGVPEGAFEVLLLAVAAPSLGESGLQALLARMPEAIVVAFQPGHEALALLRGLVPEAQLVQGLLGFIAFRPEQLGEDIDTSQVGRERVDCFFVPLSPTRLAGAAANRVARWLKRGGFPVVVDPKTEQRSTESTSVLLPIVAALEIAGWKMESFLQSGSLALAASGARESLRVARRSSLPAGSTFWKNRALTPFVLRVAMGLGSLLVPFDLGAFLVSHFRKLRQQTYDWLLSQIELAQRLRVPVPELEKMASALASNPETKP